ncbi:uncharacterized protein METZ01_LOCUS164093 [marine metagenome]|uniref:Uncharacterized protein n=1 Tax=marine metagenome TaxID=408172 RepID=A0A382BC82_9ZZZZ
MEQSYITEKKANIKRFFNNTNYFLLKINFFYVELIFQLN